MLDPNDRTRVERVDPLIGTILDRRFRIDFRVAAGGFGAIYQATHVKSGHEVALKVLHPQLAADGGVVARFRREGATLTTLRSPNTIIAYELGEAADGTMYIVMELLHGESLFERFRAQGPVPWRQMAEIARAVCDSLAEAHHLGIVHRDLKPTNIHLEPRDDGPDQVKVLDFGIAKILQDSDFDASDLTTAGQMIGTLDYMAPEQMVGGAVTGQCDIYTLGILMYEMIAGVRPFAEASNPAQALAAIISGSPPPLSRRLPVPERLDRIVSTCLARDPAERYATVEELAADLDALLANADRDADDDVTRTVALDAGATIPMDATPEPTMFSVPPPPKQVASRLTPMPRIEPVTPRPAPTSAAPPGAVGPGTPRFVRPDPTPPSGLPAASPFTTTLKGSQRPPVQGDRGSRPAIAGGSAPPPASYPRAHGMHGAHGSSGPVVDEARDARVRRLVWIAVLVIGAIVGVIAASQL